MKKNSQPHIVAALLIALVMFVIAFLVLQWNIVIAGNMFAGLVATMLNRGEAATWESLETDGRELKRFFSKLGYLESSSADLFNSLLRTGIGAKPVIVGYESQILEFSVEHPDAMQRIMDILSNHGE
jgi:hypothetical protein